MERGQEPLRGQHQQREQRPEDQERTDEGQHFAGGRSESPAGALDHRRVYERQAYGRAQKIGDDVIDDEIIRRPMKVAIFDDDVDDGGVLDCSSAYDPH